MTVQRRLSMTDASSEDSRVVSATSTVYAGTMDKAAWATCLFRGARGRRRRGGGEGDMMGPRIIAWTNFL